MNNSIQYILCLILIAASEPSSDKSAISFVDTGAFVKMDGFHSVQAGSTWTGGSLSFHVKTSSHMAILFYSSGAGKKSKQFIAAEILNGTISLSLNDGSDVTVLQSEVIVNDGLWHDVTIIFSSGYLNVTVDGKQRTLQPNSRTKPFELKNELFVGGIDLHHEFVAQEQGLNTILSVGQEGSSLVGCIKEVRVNTKLISFEEFKGVYRGVQFKRCYWNFVCLVQDPCLEDANCFQEGLSGFQCHCNHNICTRPNFTKSGYSRKIDSRPPKPTSRRPKTYTMVTPPSPSSVISETNRERIIIGAYIVTVVILVGTLISCQFYMLGRRRQQDESRTKKQNHKTGPGTSSEEPSTVSHGDQPSSISSNLFPRIVRGESRELHSSRCCGAVYNPCKDHMDPLLDLKRPPLCGTETLSLPPLQRLPW